MIDSLFLPPVYQVPLQYRYENNTPYTILHRKYPPSHDKVLQMILIALRLDESRLKMPRTKLVLVTYLIITFYGFKKAIFFFINTNYSWILLCGFDRKHANELKFDKKLVFVVK